MTISQSASNPSSGSCAGIRRQVLDPAGSNSSTSSRTASRMSVTTGSDSYSTNTSSAASTDASRDSASTMATISPAKRTVSEAIGGRYMLSWTCSIGGGGLGARPTSPAVNTCTPGSARASSTSIDVIRPWATYERTKVTNSASCGRWSST